MRIEKRGQDLKLVWNASSTRNRSLLSTQAKTIPTRREGEMRKHSLRGECDGSRLFVLGLRSEISKGGRKYERSGFSLVELESGGLKARRRRRRESRWRLAVSFKEREEV